MNRYKFVHKNLPELLVVVQLILMTLSFWEAYGLQPVTQHRGTQDLAAEFERATRDLLDVWYPRVVDETHGGYLSDFNADWEADGPQNKMIVTQARHVWTASHGFMRYPDQTQFRDIARHGFEFLRDTMWDEEHGGFYTLVTREGRPVEQGFMSVKTAYGNAFGIYGLAAYVRATGNPDALSLAQRAFRWLDEHSHDPDQGGYFQHLSREGDVIRGYNGIPPKDQNSSIHLLEALTELYHVWPDPRVRSRLSEMLFLVRDVMVQDQKYLQLYFEEDWTPVSYRDSLAEVREAHYNIDHVSVGHDVETAFLMLEATHALGIPDDSTRRVGKSMVDHALEVGWDDEAGGFYDIVYYLPGDDGATVIEDTKNWWAQAEGLNALLLMHALYPDEDPSYYDRFLVLWDYVQSNLIDPERGGWYSGGLDKEPERKEGPKSHIWKGPYHTFRSLMHCADMLGA